MSVIIEAVMIATSSLSPIALGVIALKNKSEFKGVNRKLLELESLNKREHKEINESIAYINSRNTLTKALTKICNSSIQYTEGSCDINTFKTTFTNAIIGLSIATLTSTFKFLSTDIFHGYMDVAGNKIIADYGYLPPDFTPLMRTHIQEASQIYYDNIIELINDVIFNDKEDRFVVITSEFLRTQLMIITKHWWQYSDTGSTYTEIK